MNEKEKKTADVLLTAISADDTVESRLRAVNAYREFMNAVHTRIILEATAKA